MCSSEVARPAKCASGVRKSLIIHQHLSRGDHRAKIAFEAVRTVSHRAHASRLALGLGMRLCEGEERTWKDLARPGSVDSEAVAVEGACRDHQRTILPHRATEL